jgi:uncharacterized membrane protein (DUF106 family)
MPMEQLEPLISNPEMREAVLTVMERSDGGTQELQWSDVNDTLSSGEWGRLIERGVLTEGAVGFTLANPERIKRRLQPRDGTQDIGDDLEPAPWTVFDKVAGVLAISLFAGYSVPQIQRFIATADNIVLGPIDAVLPFYAVIILLAAVTGLYSSVLQSYLMDTELMAKYRERTQELQERRKRAKQREDDAALEAIQEEQMDAMGDQMGMFKLQFRPMVWIMLLSIPVFLWMRWKINMGHIEPGEMQIVLPLAGTVKWTESLVGPFPTWIAWYFLCSLASRQLIQKVLNIRTTPTSS